MYVLCATRWSPKAIFLILGRMICRCLFYLSSHQCLFKSEVNSPSTFVNITLVRSSKWAAVQLFPAPWKQTMLSVPELINPISQSSLTYPAQSFCTRWTGHWVTRELGGTPPVPPSEHPAPPTPGLWCRTASPLKVNHKSCPRTWPPCTAKDLKSVCPQPAE